MFNWKEFEKTKQVLSHMGGSRYTESWGLHNLTVRPIDLLDWIKFLKEDMGYLTLVDVAGNDCGPGIEIVYHLLNMGTHQRLNLHLMVQEGEIIPSITDFYPHADWPEREQAEMLNLRFDKSQEPLLLPDHGPNHRLEFPRLRFNPNKSEAPYPEESYQWKRFDLAAPDTLGNFEWMLCFDPVRVVKSIVEVGFHHQGLEKLFRTKDIFQIIHLADKVNLSAAPHYSTAWCRMIEDMFRIKIPERAQALRIVFLELGRIADHLTVLHSICYHGEFHEHRLILDLREKVYELFEKYSGYRHGLGTVKIGGMTEELPPGWIVEYQDAFDKITKKLHLVHNSLVSRSRFRKLLSGNPVNAQSVMQAGVSGPAMRAAGLNFDLRKSRPFYFYQDIDFDIPVGINGTAFDRYLIRYEEILQSLRIITQVIDNLPLGRIVDENFDLDPLALMEHFRQLDPPINWHYSGLEMPSGEGGFLVQLGPELRPSRIKMKTPSFTMAQAMSIFVDGLQEEQLKVCMASLGLSRWEIDR